LRTEDFSFELPEELIAQFPPERRGESRLMVLDRSTGSISHSAVRELPSFVEEGSLIVFNDSRVRKARLVGRAIDTGGIIEFLLLRRCGPADWLAVASRAKRQKPGRRYLLPESVQAEIVGAPDGGAAGHGETRILRFDPPIDDDYLERVGHIPLPPYIRREDAPADAERYQTVYSRVIGSSASPTAGLHFTDEILESLVRKGILFASVTLHVGLGTFLPVRSEEVEAHRMHEEEYEIPEATRDAVMSAKAEGRPVLAVGTTSLRALESAWREEEGPAGLRSGRASTSIFIVPGYDFKVVDGLFTNFHTPRSTLLMLVSAFAGRERILGAYEEAIRMRYRFFSYGDAMLLV
jgi:S-adenosylmethionine:tRNA ribosyltransferase-isomerase